MPGSYRASKQTACAFRGTSAGRVDAIFSSLFFWKIGIRVSLAMKDVSRLRARGDKGAEEFSAVGGRRNALKRLDSAKEIKGNQSLFL
jgi:hypothetical protein